MLVKTVEDLEREFGEFKSKSDARIDELRRQIEQMQVALNDLKRLRTKRPAKKGKHVGWNGGYTKAMRMERAGVTDESTAKKGKKKGKAVDQSNSPAFKRRMEIYKQNMARNAPDQQQLAAEARARYEAQMTPEASAKAAARFNPQTPTE